MAKTTLKIVDRKTTVPREKVREAFAAVMGDAARINGKPYESNGKETVKSTSAAKKP